MVAAILAAVLAVLALAAPAAAQRAADPDLPRADPRGYWRQVTLDPETTTSKCIGNLSTPLCAVETMVACRERHDWDMCAAASSSGWRPVVEGPVSRFFSRSRYRIAWTGRVTRRTLDDIPWYHSSAQPGDLRIEVLLIPCTVHPGHDENCGPAIWGPIIHIVRRVDGNWRVVAARERDHRWEPKR